MGWISNWDADRYLKEQGSSEFNPIWPIGDTWPTTLRAWDAAGLYCISTMYRYYNFDGKGTYYYKPHGTICNSGVSKTRDDPGNVYNAFDVSALSGTKIYAIESGTVYDKGYQANGFGYYIVIKHNNGMLSLYGHMQKASSYSKGNSVSKGDIIGYCGSTGNSSGSHLHFEVYYLDNRGNVDKGRIINPWVTFYQDKIAVRIGGNSFKANVPFTSYASQYKSMTYCKYPGGVGKFDSAANAWIEWLLADKVKGSASSDFSFEP